ncbi:MAG: FHA domain-containing protein, partial [Kiritimatiellaceae bacterium]|nr:FHA domain-containing protein [Kiritimatiellaceae bacterium]
MATLVLHPNSPDSRLVLLDKPSLIIGSATDVDICLNSESVSARHARIEHKPDGYYVISLTSTFGVLVNGTEITFQRLKHGDKLDIGGIKALLLLSDEELSAHDSLRAEQPAMPMLPATMMSAGLTTPPKGPVRCPQCGMPLMPGAPACAHCGLMFSNLPAMPMGFIPPIQTGQNGPGILPIIALLAALTVVGAPIALVLGLMTFSIIRKRGGTARDQVLAKWSVGLGLVWLMLGAVAAVVLVRNMKLQDQMNAAKVQQLEQRKVIEVNEAKVIRALKNLACAQKYAQTTESYDADADGQGEYGTLLNLTEAKSPFFDADLTDGKAYGYEFAIPQTSEGQFLAVAEPVRYGETGARTFVINQDGRIRGADAGGQRFGQGSTML